MKYARFLIAVLLVSAFALSGCQSKAQDTAVPQQTTSPEPEKKEEHKIVLASSDDPRKAMKMTKLREFSYDTDGDNIEEKLELYTSAGRDSKGNMMWDDGQQWLLVILDGDTFYSLLSDYVQLGQVYFNVAIHGEEKLPRVTMMISTGAGLKLLSYIYNSEKQGYTEEMLYDSKTICEYFTSIPSY